MRSRRRAHAWVGRSRHRALALRAGRAVSAPVSRCDGLATSPSLKRSAVPFLLPCADPLCLTPRSLGAINRPCRVSAVTCVRIMSLDSDWKSCQEAATCVARPWSRWSALYCKQTSSTKHYSVNSALRTPGRRAPAAGGRPAPATLRGARDAPHRVPARSEALRCGRARGLTGVASGNELNTNLDPFLIPTMDTDDGTHGHLPGQERPTLHTPARGGQYATSASNV